MTDVDHPVVSPKKLIEVALPLDAINAASAATKRKAPKGYPSSLHTWWAQRPVSAARAVIFCQLVNDPEDLWRHQNPGVVPNKQVRGHWTKARQRLFKIIEDLVLWKNSTNEDVLERASEEIRKSWREVCELNENHPQADELFRPDKMPGLHDPFAGGGTIPLEAQRLGLTAFGSDLNPVAVLINKAMIEIPPKFAGRPPVHPDVRRDKKLFAKEWKGNQGLAEDVRRYGQWMRDEANNRLGHLYPKVEITAHMAKDRPDLKAFVGRELSVIAWLWARTVTSPNPAFASVDVPLVSTFVLSTSAGRGAYVEPHVTSDGYTFHVKPGKPPPAAKAGTSLGKQKGFRCLMSGTPIDFDYIRNEANAGRIGQRLMAIVADGGRGRIYLPPTSAQEAAAKNAAPSSVPETAIPDKALSIRVQLYGMHKHSALFTKRQLTTMCVLCDLITEVGERVLQDALNASSCGERDRGLPVDRTAAADRAAAICLFLAFANSRVADYGCTIATWRTKDNAMRSMFSKQSMPMTWDFAEGSPFGKSSSGFSEAVKVIANVMDLLPAGPWGTAVQADAQDQGLSRGRFVSTDPPYYDNIGYADLSDFFYCWLRRSLRNRFPELLATIAVPKAEELVATPYRHGTKEKAESFFLDGMTRAMHGLSMQAHPAAPLTIYYAFKQSDTRNDRTNSAGWETFLEAAIRSGLAIVGTWPVRTEGDNRQVGQDANALASSIVLVCRPRAGNAGTISRKQFIRQLNATLPDALAKMTGAEMTEHSPVAPVDLSQAIIGPGMAIFSKYEAVLEADGTPMTVKTALQLINRFLAEDDFDADTQFCLHWFDECGWDAGKFGQADTLARAKGTSVDGVKDAGVIESGSGNVRLLKWKEYDADWDATTDSRLPVWEVLHRLIRAYSSQGDAGAAKVLAACANKAEAARQLAYRLYTLCERKGWAEDARAYNEVVTGWTGIEKAAVAGGASQRELFDA